MVTIACAEPPSPYSYNRPSSGNGGLFGAGSSLSGNFQQQSFGGFDSNEGAQVDPQLLEQVRQILLREESQSSQNIAAPSSQYGVPSNQYGPPQVQARVVNIQLERTVPALQVAAFSQQSYAQQQSYPQASYAAPQASYAAPSQQYGAPSNVQQQYLPPQAPQGPY